MYQPGDVMQFPDVTTNIGSAYDPSTSFFYCPVSGLYLFAVSMFGDYDRYSEAVIAKDGLAITTAWAEYNEDTMGSNIVFLECYQGDRIDVRCGNVWDICSFNGDKYLGANSFSGVLLFAM